MRADGNLLQWAGDYPGTRQLEQDMGRGVSYVIEEDGRLVGTFAFIVGEEPTYARIFEGNWPDTPSVYGTVHRLACAEGTHGIADTCLDWCFTQISCVRIDTHADNRIMRYWMESRGFRYCGIIYVADGTPRRAYQKNM